jgi:hypothetical protein
VKSETDIVLAHDLSSASLLEFRRGIAHPVLLALFDYWWDLTGRNGLPSRAAIEPAHIPLSALPSTMLLDVVRQKTAPSAFRLRFRLVGTAVVELREGMTPRDPTGRYLDEVQFREGAAGPVGFYSAVAIEGRPGFQTWVYGSRHPRFRGTYHRLALPLSDDGRSVNMLLAGFSREPTTQESKDPG